MESHSVQPGFWRTGAQMAVAVRRLQGRPSLSRPPEPTQHKPPNHVWFAVLRSGRTVTHRAAFTSTCIDPNNNGHLFQSLVGGFCVGNRVEMVFGFTEAKRWIIERVGVKPWRNGHKERRPPPGWDGGEVHLFIFRIKRLTAFRLTGIFRRQIWSFSGLKTEDVAENQELKLYGEQKREILHMRPAGWCLTKITGGRSYSVCYFNLFILVLIATPLYGTCWIPRSEHMVIQLHGGRAVKDYIQPADRSWNWL